MPKKTKDLKYYQAIGRRKRAVAQVRLYIGGKAKPSTVSGNKIKPGEILVNQKPIAKIFPSEVEKSRYMVPLKQTKNEDRFAISIILKGGGRSGQLDAISLGLARALEKVDREANRPVLKRRKLLTRDARVKERRKVGTGGKARRKKQSPKR